MKSRNRTPQTGGTNLKELLSAQQQREDVSSPRGASRRTPLSRAGSSAVTPLTPSGAQEGYATARPDPLSSVIRPAGAGAPAQVFVLPPDDPHSEPAHGDSHDAHHYASSATTTGARGGAHGQAHRAQAQAQHGSPRAGASSSSVALARRVKAILAGLRSRFFLSKGSMRETFRNWDANSNGVIDADELSAALNALGYAVSTDEARGVVQAFDGNADGVVQYDDFVSLLCGNEGDTFAVTATDEEVAFTRGGRSSGPGGVGTGDPNLGVRPTQRWAATELKRALGPAELMQRRHASVHDVAAGRGGDSLAESMRLARDRKVAELRGLFSNDLLEEQVREYARGVPTFDAGMAGVAAGDDGGGGAFGGDGVEEGAGRETMMMPHLTPSLAHLGPASDAASPVPRLPLNTLRSSPRRERVRPGAEAVKACTLDLSLSARARVPAVGAGIEGPMTVVDNELDPNALQPDTGAGTWVTGEVGGARTRDPLRRIVASNVARVRRTGPGPLDSVLTVPFSPINTARERRIAGRRADWMRRSGVQYMGGEDGREEAEVAEEQVGFRAERQPQQQPHARSDTTETAADRMQRERLEKLQRIGLAPADGIRQHSHVANSNDLRQRLVRAEGARTSYLIAPPPGVFTSHSAEEPQWHFASMSRLAQTGRVRVQPEGRGWCARVGGTRSVPTAAQKSPSSSHSPVPPCPPPLPPSPSPSPLIRSACRSSTLTPSPTRTSRRTTARALPTTPLAWRPTWRPRR
jgi:hypothetical protein